MSGRPGDPSYTTRTFAPDADYPSGPEVWNGQPTKVEPAGASSVGFTPDTGAAAEEMNQLFSDAFTQGANAKTEIGKVLEWTGQGPALNFRAKTTGPAAGSQNFAFFAKASRRWYILANGEDVRSSTDGALSWTVETGVATAGAGEAVLHGDADAASNVVLSTDSRYVFALNASTSTWTKVDVVGAAWDQATRVAFDPIRAKWVWAGINAGVAFSVFASTDRATWSAATAPPNPTSWNGVAWSMAVRKSDGRVVLGGAYTGTTVRFAYTDNAGTTWTTGAAQASGIASPTIGSVSYNEAEDAFYFTVGETSGVASCEIWRSADGITWTLKATLTGMALRHIAGLGALLIAVGSTGDVVFSLDQGATWQFAGMAVEGTPRGVFLGANRPMIVTTTYSYSGYAMGDPELGNA